MRIILDAGHDISSGDPGACYKELKEAVLTRKIVAYALDEFKKNNIKALAVPDLGKSFIEKNLNRKIKWINKNSIDGDFLISVHLNAGGGTGVEVWGYKGLPMQKWYNCILNNCLTTTGLHNRGIKDEKNHRFGQLGIIHNTKPPACLIECGFIDNEKDMNYPNIDKRMQDFGKGIVRGCLEYFNKFK